MGVDTSSVFKRPLHCLTCDGAFYFTLRSIVESQELLCPHCATSMDLSDEIYLPIVGDVRTIVTELDEPR